MILLPDENRYHSKDKGCEIYPDKKSWFQLGPRTEKRTKGRYSRHYCVTHKVFLGHFKETGVSDRAWELGWYFGTESVTDQDRAERFKYQRKLTNL